MSYELCVRSQFSAAHAITFHGGKCENLHGHNFDVEIKVRGETLNPRTGMLVDFSILKKALAKVLEKLDHADLNELPEFAGKSPSSENIASFIGGEMLAALSDIAPEATLHSVAISEKSTQTAIWFP